MLVLLAVKDTTTRTELAQLLSLWGFQVTVANTGTEAWDLFLAHHYPILLLGLDLAGLTGPQICERIKSQDATTLAMHYVCLLTEHADDPGVIQGLEAGADQFLSKPYPSRVLRAHLKTAERQIWMRQILDGRMQHLKNLFTQTQHELRYAGRLQSHLLPKNIRFETLLSAWSFASAGLISGDMLNLFQLTTNQYGFYILDVAGHGVGASLMSITLNKFLTPSTVSNSLLYASEDLPLNRDVRPPKDTVHLLNQLFQTNHETMQYFTLVYGVIDTDKDQLSLVQAGHPEPIYLPAAGPPKLISSGGMAIGILPDESYEQETLPFQKGDRLIAYSDGVTECVNEHHEQFTQARLLQLVEEERHRPITDLVEVIKNEIRNWERSPDPEDDQSILILERQ